MKRNEILEVIKSLARSQGFYSRIYNRLIDLKENDIDSYNEIMESLESQNFKDSLDIVFYFEC